MRWVLPIAIVCICTPISAQDPVPDTTDAWRYFPLEIGNVWEYRCLGNFCDDYVRNGIRTDTLVAGERFFAYVIERFSLDGQPTGGSETYYLRYDTLAARVVELEDSLHLLFPVCPLDADFNDEIDCDGDGLPDGSTSGGVQSIVLGSQTISATVKTYDLFHPDLAQTFVAGLGIASGASINGGYTLGYVRVGGVEYGEPIIVAVEPDAGGVGTLSLASYPNPSDGIVTLDLTVPSAQTVTVEVFDALGRRVHTEERAVSGAAQLTLDGSEWPPGVYVVRVLGGEGESATMRILKR